jgi:hypothetical protein
MYGYYNKYDRRTLLKLKSIELKKIRRNTFVEESNIPHLLKEINPNY